MSFTKTTHNFVFLCAMHGPHVCEGPSDTFIIITSKNGSPVSLEPEGSL